MTLKQILNTSLTVLMLGLTLAGVRAQTVVMPPVVLPEGNALGGVVDINRAITGAVVIESGPGYRTGVPLAVSQTGIYALSGPGIVYDNPINNGDMPIQYDVPIVYDENSNYNNDYANRRYYRPSRVPHDRDRIQAQRLKNGQIKLSWKGDPRIVAGIQFALLDRKGNPVKKQMVTKLPATVQFTRPRTALYYGAMIFFIDGKNNTILSRI